MVQPTKEQPVFIVLHYIQAGNTTAVRARFFLAKSGSQDKNFEPFAGGLNKLPIVVVKN